MTMNRRNDETVPLCAALLLILGCEMGGATGGPGVEPPVLGPGGDDYTGLAMDADPAVPPGGLMPDAQANEPLDGGTDIETGHGDAGPADRESCLQGGKSFREDFEKAAGEHASCESAEQCTIIRARMECPWGGVRLDTCAHAVNIDELTDLETALGSLAAITYCTGELDGCVDEPECDWPQEEATCVDGRCKPVYP
jgi:hypothetical protein